MGKILFNKLSYTYLAFCIISIGIVFITGNLLNFMMGFNVGLAYIPVLLIGIINYSLKQTDYKLDWKSMILVVLFILFFPNSFYVITDLIHLDKSLFINYNVYTDTVSYLHNFKAYLGMFHIAFTLLFGVYAGVLSMDLFIKVLKKFNYKELTNQIIIFLLVFSSSVAIYIGRFLRFFSWEAFNIMKILRELINRFGLFMFLFIVMFIIVQYLCYYLYKGILKVAKNNS